MKTLFLVGGWSASCRSQNTTCTVLLLKCYALVLFWHCLAEISYIPFETVKSHVALPLKFSDSLVVICFILNHITDLLPTVQVSCEIFHSILK